MSDKKFVIIIPSYNNQDWCEQNIKSVLDQNYKNYRIIFTDDASTDKTFIKVFKKVKKSTKTNLVTLIKNNRRVKSLKNIYNMIHSCDNDEIIIVLDGDDWLSNNDVLNKLNHYYSTNDIWLTYGQYKNTTTIGNKFDYEICGSYPQEVIDWNAFRDYEWLASPLRTFYAFLFKNIKKEDLCDENGVFFQATTDMAMMFPMLEMSGDHIKYISKILYIYNVENPFNTHLSNMNGFQKNIEIKIRNMPKYQKL